MADLDNIEWFVPDPSIEVRQGDVLICRNPRTGHVNEICLVITADCDISRFKSGWQLACLRIVFLAEYIRTTWAVRKLNKALRDESEKVRGQVAKWHTRILGSQSTLTSEAMTAWVRREDPKSICNSLQVPDGDRQKFIAAITAFHNALNSIETSAAKDGLAQLVAFKAAIRGKEPHECHQEALLQAQKESFPEDVFLLPSLPQLDDGAAVVLLREVTGISRETICYRATDADSSDIFLRVGRLHPTFKYAISQAFGSLYSRIGLPSDYEARCKGAIEELGKLAWE